MKEKSLQAWWNRPKLAQMPVAGLIIVCAAYASITSAQAPAPTPAAAAATPAAAATAAPGLSNPFGAAPAPGAAATPIANTAATPAGATANTAAPVPGAMANPFGAGAAIGVTASATPAALPGAIPAAAGATPAAGAAPNAANPFAASPAVPGAAPAQNVTSQPAGTAAAGAGSSFANPFKGIFGRRPGTGTGTSVKAPNAPAQPSFAPPNPLIIQMRQAIAEQRYNDIKDLSDKYALIDPKSGLAEFFMTLSRIRKDTITERQQMGGLFLAQYGSRSGATQPASKPVSMAPAGGTTDVASAAGSQPVGSSVAGSGAVASAIGASGALATAPVMASAAQAGTAAAMATPLGVSATPPVNIASATPAHTPAIAAVARPAAVRTPVSFESEPVWKTYLKPTAYGAGGLVVLIALLALVRRKKTAAVPAPATAPVPPTETEAVSTAPKTDSSLGLGIDMTPVGAGIAMAPAAAAAEGDAFGAPDTFSDPFATPSAFTPQQAAEATAPTQILPTSGLAAMDGFEELNFGPTENLGGPNPTGELPVDEEEDEVAEPPSKIEFGDMFSTPSQDALQIGSASAPVESGSAPSQGRPRDASVDDLLNFIPMEQDRPSAPPPDTLEKPSGLGLSEFDLNALDAKSDLPSEQPSRDESMGGLSFEDLLTAAPPPANPPSRSGGSALSLNDFESSGRGSSLTDRSSGSAPIGFDDLLVSPPPGNMPDETGSSLDLNNIELPSAPSAESDSYISDFDDIKTPVSEMNPPREMERTDDFHKKFEDLMFNVVPPPPPPTEETQPGATTAPITTDMNIRWTGSPEDTQPSDIGMDMEPRQPNEDTQTNSKRDTKPDTKPR